MPPPTSTPNYIHPSFWFSWFRNRVFSIQLNRSPDQVDLREDSNSQFTPQWSATSIGVRFEIILIDHLCNWIGIYLNANLVCQTNPNLSSFWNENPKSPFLAPYSVGMVSITCNFIFLIKDNNSNFPISYFFIYSTRMPLATSPVYPWMVCTLCHYKRS